MKHYFTNMMFLFVFLCLFSSAFGNDTYVVNGNPAPAGRWPWMGSLRLMSAESHYCGCAIISANYGITAAHCVGTPQDRYAVFGTNNVETDPGTVVYFSEITKHPEWVGGCEPNACYPYDIAVLTFAEPVSETEVIQYGVMTDGTDYINTGCWIKGWGQLAGDAGPPTDLYETEVRVPDDDECTERNNPWYHPDHQVCAFDDTEPRGGACFGDSGSPLSCPDNSGGWRIVGVCSWVSGDCDTNYPSGYADVASYRSWICTIVDVC